MKGQLRAYNNRMIAPSWATVPIELRPFGNVRSFPICPDIMRRLIQANPDIGIDSGLAALMKEMKSKQDRLERIKGYEDFDGDKRLYPFQRVGVAWLMTVGAGVLADDQGLGKTVQAASAALTIMRLWKKGIEIGIICTDSNLSSWASHMCEFFVSGEAVKSKSRGIINVGHQEGSCTRIVNFDNVEALSDMGLDILIVDEAHHVRNRKTELFKQVDKAARRAQFVFLLTASPTVNADFDMWTLLHLCDPQRFSSYWSYIYRFFDIQDTMFGIKILGIKEREKDNFQRMISVYMLHRDESVNKLPMLKRSVIPYKLQGEHLELYKHMEAEWVAVMNEKRVTASVKVAHITRLRQLAVSPQLLFDDYRGEDKIEAVVRVIKDSPGMNIVVFTAFEKAAAILKERLDEQLIPCGLLTGKVRKRDEVIGGFGSSTRVLVITHKTGGESLTLTQAHLAIFLDLAWHPAGNRHAMKRIHRIGQDKDVEAIYIKSEDTIEEYVLEILRKKGKMSVSDLIKAMKERLCAR